MNTRTPYRFSFMDIARRKGGAGAHERGPEDEISLDRSRQAGIDPKGWMIPAEVLRRTLSAGSGSGANLVGNEQQPGIRDPRGDLVLEELGVRTIPATGNPRIPRLASEPDPEFVTEGTGATASDATIEQAAATPYAVTANFVMTNKVRTQGGQYVDTVILPAVMDRINAMEQRAVLHGTGADGQPTGLAGTSGVNVVAVGVGGGAPSAGIISQVQRAVYGADVEPKRCSFLGNPDVTAKLMLTARGADIGGALLDSDGKSLMGTPYFNSTIVRDDLTKGDGTGLSGLFFGDWRDLAIVRWGGDAVDVTFDPYTHATQGLIRVTLTRYFDVVVLRPSSFSCVLDLETV